MSMASQPLAHARSKPWRNRSVATFAMLAAALVLSGCGGGSASTAASPAASSVAKYQGTFIDAKVENLAWRTSTRSGITDSQGRFGFDTPGEEVTFSIGGMDLGSANADISIHVFDLENATPEQAGIKGTRLAQLLQTLDTDKNPTNGITLPPSIHAQFANDTDIQMLGSAALWNAKLTQIAAAYGAQPVDTASAYAHASSNIATASANCVISDSTYQLLVGGSFSTAGMSCTRKAQLAALYAKILPGIDGDISSLLNDPIINNGEAITINNIKKSLDENVIRSGFQSFYDSIDTGVDAADAIINRGSKLKIVAATAGFTVPLVEFFAKVSCKFEEKCSKEYQKGLIVPQIVLEVGNIASCVKGDGPACADALDVVFKEKGLLESFGLAPTKEDSIALNQLIRTSIPPLKAALDLAQLENPKLLPAKALRLVGEFAEYGSKMVSGTAMMTSEEDYKNWAAAPGSYRKAIDAIGEGVNLVATCKAAVISAVVGSALETIKSSNECVHKATESYIKSITTTIYAGTTFGNAKSIMDSNSDYKIVIAVLQELFRRNTFPEAFSTYSLEFSSSFFSNDPYPDYLTKQFMVKVASAVGEPLATPFHQNFVFDRVQSAIVFVNNDSKKFQNGTVGVCTDVNMNNVIAVGANGGVGKAKSSEQIGITATTGGVQPLGYLISWGDGSSTVSSSAGGVHTYFVPGYFQIQITPYIQGASSVSECTGKRKVTWVHVSDNPSINSSPTVPTAFQAISFWISNAYQTIKSVIWNFGTGIAEQTATVANGISTSISQAFSSAGNKTVTATYRDAAGTVLGQDSATISVAAASIPSATIDAAKSDSANQAGVIANNGSTDDDTPTLTGTISSSLSNGQKVNLYDGATMFAAVAVVNGTSWSFTPTTELTPGRHSFTAEVATFDGTPGARSAAFVINVSLAPQVASISPASATIGVASTFTVTGARLPQTAVLSIADGSCDAGTYGRTGSGSEFTVTCTPGGPLGLKVFTVKTDTLANGGTVIDATRTVVVNPAVALTSQTITFNSPGNQTIGVSPPALSATATSGLSVALSTATQSVCTVSGTTMTLVAAGTCTITATQGGNSTYAAANAVNVSFTVANAPVSRYATVGSYPITDCVKDNTTGLMWEGKPTTGLRAAGNPYTNFDSPYGAYGTPAQISAATNTIGYVAAVNAAGLCGFNNWRLPTKDELLTLFIQQGIGNPAIDRAWFPNQQYRHWTSTPVAGFPTHAWVVDFQYGVGDNYRNYTNVVRLVR